MELRELLEYFIREVVPDAVAMQEEQYVRIKNEIMEDAERTGRDHIRRFMVAVFEVLDSKRSMNNFCER